MAAAGGTGSTDGTAREAWHRPHSAAAAAGPSASPSTGPVPPHHRRNHGSGSNISSNPAEAITVSQYFPSDHQHLVHIARTSAAAAADNHGDDNSDEEGDTAEGDEAFAALMALAAEEGGVDAMTSWVAGGGEGLDFDFEADLSSAEGALLD